MVSVPMPCWLPSLPVQDLVNLKRALGIAAAEPLDHLLVALGIVGIEIVELPFQLETLRLQASRDRRRRWP